MVDSSDTPMEVTVIGGYLGAGKTTLVNHLLSQATEVIAVLINDFGEINIDDKLVDSADENTITLTNGCICCSLADGYSKALDDVAKRNPRPTRLVIEASGVADPAAVAAYGHAPGMALNAVAVVADSVNLIQQLADPLVGQTVRSQLAAADLILLNKTDLAPETETVRTELDRFNSDALLVECVHSRIDLDLLFGSEVTKVPKASEAVGEYESRCHTSNQPIPRDALIELIERLPEQVQRAKGIVRVAEEPQIPMVFQLVGRRWELRALADRKNAPEGNQLVVIGPKGTVPLDWDRTLKVED
ncbi:MAG: GTP-binding protein [Actinomycetota bacterium]|nr:GTP-binding protein [Actinomycetota bacterium]